MNEASGNRASAGAKLWKFAKILALVWIVVVEVGTRVLPIPGLSRAELDPSQESIDSKIRSTGHPYLAYAGRPNWSTEGDEKQGQKSHDARGFRNPSPALEKPPGVFRIACIGGSSTYGNSPSSDETTWPAQLQTILNERQGTPVEVLNAGLYGWSTFESLINFSLRVVDYAPDLVIVYHAINDMRAALYAPGGATQPDNLQWRESWPRLVPTPGEALLEKSQTYLIWRKYLSSYGKDHVSLGFYAIKNYDPDDPDPFTREEPSAQGFYNFQRNLINLRAVAQAHGAMVMFGTQGCDRADIQAGSREQQWAGLDRIEAITRQVALERQVPLCESRLALETTAQELGRDVIFTGEVHLTDEGARVLATSFADRIQELDLIP